MSFLRLRNIIMFDHECGRKVATIAARMVLGVDTWEGIFACDQFTGRPLLTHDEAQHVCRIIHYFRNWSKP
jgi:hypothetical protein